MKTDSESCDVDAALKPDNRLRWMVPRGPGLEKRNVKECSRVPVGNVIPYYAPRLPLREYQAVPAFSLVLHGDTAPAGATGE